MTSNNVFQFPAQKIVRLNPNRKNESIVEDYLEKRSKEKVTELATEILEQIEVSMFRKGINLSTMEPEQAKAFLFMSEAVSAFAFAVYGVNGHPFERLIDITFELNEDTGDIQLVPPNIEKTDRE